MIKYIVLLMFLATADAACGGAALPAPLFADDAVLEAELLAPLYKAYRQKNTEERPWLAGKWKIDDIAGKQVALDVGIRTRGIFRRKNCKLPPLRLNFKKKQTKGTLFEGQDKLKLVSPCNTTQSAQQHIILEYLAYRTLGVLTQDSLRARLVRLNYVNSDSKKKPWTHLTFLIENEAGLAARRGVQALHVPKLVKSQLDEEKAAIVELFQYLIGNNDYSTIRGPKGRDCCHNVEIIGPPGATDGLVPIPYDFDASGLVNTGYAAPPEKLSIKTVRTRYFRGRCRSPEIWAQTFALFQSKRNEIIDLFANSAHLSPRMKKKNIKYIEAFYKVLDEPKRLKREIMNRCYAPK